jgi:hypothetical protein
MLLIEIKQKKKDFVKSLKDSGILAMRKFIFLVLILLLPVISTSVSYAQNVTRIYSSDSMAISKFFKIKTPRAGFDNGYFQLSGYNSLPNIDYRNLNVYRIMNNYVSDNMHNNSFRSHYNLCSPPFSGITFGGLIDFTISEVDSNLILAGSSAAECEPYEGMGYSLNNGLTGNPIFSQTFMSFVIGMAINPKNDSNMFAAYRFQGANYVYKTTNRGTNWFVTDTIPNMTRAVMKVNPLNASVVFLSSGSTLLRSSTAGYDFSTITIPGAGINSMEFDSLNRNIYVTSNSGTALGIFKSDQNGIVWTRIFDKTCSTLEIDPLNPNVLFAGTNEGIYKSTNGGNNWELYNNTFQPSKNVIGLIKNPDMGDTLLAITNKAVYKVYGAFKAFTDYNYFPLKVGNSWTYRWEDSFFQFGYNKYTVTGDTIVNGYRYYKMFSNDIGNVVKLVALDSLTGNLYWYSSSAQCNSSAGRLLRDSLAARLNNPYSSCIPTINRCNDTSDTFVFGIPTKSKRFEIDGLVNEQETYAKGFGLIRTVICEGTCNVSDLQGCVIDGVVYGDTSLHASPYKAYLPLKVGNSWTYIRRVIPAPDEEITITIVGETTINGVKYYQTNQPFPTFMGNENLITLDTVTGNIFTYDATLNCSYNPKQKLKDSLAAKQGNFFTSCSAFMNGRCTDTNNVTVFGLSVKSMSFVSPYYVTVDCSQTFAKGFGMIRGMAVEGDIINYSLIKCTIDGITYSDSLKSISGTIKFADNNQFANNGYVKALKLNTSTGNIITYDSTQIGIEGTYNLNVPSDLYYIVAYPNSEKQADFIPTYFPSTISWQSAVKVNSANNPSNVNISVYRKTNIGGAYSVNGWITIQTNNFYAGINDAIVYIKQGNNFRDFYVTQNSGQFSLNSLTSGNYEVVVDRLGYVSAQQIATVTNGNLENINFALIRVGIHTISNVIPDKFNLYQNYPNPFNPVTNIKFDIPKSSFVTLKVYNVLGKESALLLNESKSAGSYEIDFDASSLTSGVYFYRIETESFTETKRMVILK